MSNKVIALLLLFNGVLVVVGNIVENKSMVIF